MTIFYRQVPLFKAELKPVCIKLSSMGHFNKHYGTFPIFAALCKMWWFLIKQKKKYSRERFKLEDLREGVSKYFYKIFIKHLLHYVAVTTTILWRHSCINLCYSTGIRYWFYSYCQRTPLVLLTPSRKCNKILLKCQDLSNLRGICIRGISIFLINRFFLKSGD